MIIEDNQYIYMISIQSNKPTDGITIVVDKEGVNDLIQKLTYITQNDESIILNKAVELEPTPQVSGYYVCDALKIVYSD